MANLTTNNITVIPAVRKSLDISRLTSEETLTNIVRSVGPNGGCFLITEDITSNTIEFCVEGYYVKVKKEDVSKVGDNVYAQCVYATTDGSIKELNGEDLTGTYLGIKFISSIDSSSNGKYTLIIKNKQINTDISFAKLLSTNISEAYYPFFLLSGGNPDGELKRKIWIDTTAELNVLKIYNTSKSEWQTIAATAK